jgi:hypothetical protein
MTTRAEEIAAEGPYSKFGDPKIGRWYVLCDPDPYVWELDERQIDARVIALNAAFIKGYKQGQQDRWIPEGWALVPLVATPEMLLNAGFPASSTGDSTTGQNTWEWFVKSAPSPPNHEQP